MSKKDIKAPISKVSASNIEQSPLVSAIIAAADSAEYAFSYRQEGEDGTKATVTKEIPIASLSDAQHLHLHSYGSRLFNDRWNSWKHTAAKGGRPPEGLDDPSNPEKAFTYFVEHVLGTEPRATQQRSATALVPPAERQAVEEYITGKLAVPAFLALFKTAWTTERNQSDGTKTTVTARKPTNLGKLRECLGAIAAEVGQAEKFDAQWLLVEKGIKANIAEIEAKRNEAQDEVSTDIASMF